ncbi:MAG: barstar family protein [Pseudoclavibacter sp.]|nr:barstar family protein [Pseudoclavibacter sp.]
MRYLRERTGAGRLRIRIELGGLRTAGEFRRRVREACDVPGHLGPGADALDEAMRELGWLGEREVELCCTGLERLAARDVELHALVIETLSEWRRFWRQRPERPRDVRPQSVHLRF